MGKVFQHKGKVYSIEGDKDLCVATKASRLPNNKILVEEMRFSKNLTEDDVVKLILNNKYETLSDNPNI